MNTEDLNFLGQGDLNFDENLYCEVEGRRAAKIEIFKNLYKREYILNPLKRMREKEMEVDDLKQNMLKDICMITFNFTPGALVNNEMFYFLNMVLKSRTWIKKIYAYGWEMIETGSHPHLHFCVKLQKLYGPCQMRKMLEKNKIIEDYMLEPGMSLHVDKYWHREKQGKIDYVTKCGRFCL